MVTCIFVLFLWLSAACLEDLKTGKISNALALGTLLCGLGERLYEGGGRSLGEGLLCALVWLGLAYPLYQLAMVGAGDVKLLAALQSYFSFEKGMKYLYCMLLMAGMFAFTKMLKQKSLRSRFRYFASYVTTSVRLGVPQQYLPQQEKEMQVNARLPMTVPMLAGFILYVGVCVGGQN